VAWIARPPCSALGVAVSGLMVSELAAICLARLVVLGDPFSRLWLWRKTGERAGIEAGP
jgi:hypothetical protein